MVTAADYPFLDIFWTMILFFLWITWFWMLIVIIGDLFSRSDASGWGKAAWCVGLIFLPFLGVLTYLVVNGSGMNERRAQESKAARNEFDDYVKTVAADAGPASEIKRAKELLDSGAITEVEFTSLKAKALA